LQKFSWNQYWMVVVAVVALYYAFVFVLLLKNGILNKASFKNFLLAKIQQLKPSPTLANQQTVDTAVKLHNKVETGNILQQLTDEILRFLQDIAGKSFIREEIIMGIQVIAREYKELSETNYKSDIEEFIKIETENHCSVDLSDEEIQRVWMG
jgi:hypothetical protein